MAIDIIVTITVRKPRIEEFLDMLVALASVTASEPGCSRFEVFRTEKASTDVVLIERWLSRDAITEHMSRSYTTDFVEATRDMIEATRLLDLVPVLRQTEGGS